MDEGTVKNLAVLLSMSLIISPLFDDIRVIKNEKRISKEKSANTFLMIWLSSVIWTIYGVFIEAYHPIVTTNMIGIGSSSYFLYVFHYYSSLKQKKLIEDYIKYMIIMINIVLVYVVYLPEGIETTKTRLGMFGSFLSVSMFAAPVLNVMKVIKTKNPSYISFPFAFLGSLSTYLWYTFGKMIDDIWVIGPNLIGLGLSLTTCLVWLIYMYIVPFLESCLLGYQKLKQHDNNSSHIDDKSTP